MAESNQHAEEDCHILFGIAINDCLERHNIDPKPFAWTASASSIIEKVNRGKQPLGSLR